MNDRPKLRGVKQAVEAIENNYYIPVSFSGYRQEFFKRGANLLNITVEGRQRRVQLAWNVLR